MLVLAGAILTSTLVSAKALLHQTILTKTQTAMSDATEAFVASTQAFVKQHGSEPSRWPISQPTTEALCTAAAGAGNAGVTCPYLATMNWAVTGSSATVAQANANSGAAADASYLANTIDEQRISATISVQVSNQSGTVVYGERSREITARIFDAAPYVVVTGARDISTEDGNIHSSEGDTAGALQTNDLLAGSADPNPGYPTYYTDTRILTSIDCSNSVPGTTRPIGNAFFDTAFHPYGNVAWSFESSCSSANTVAIGIPIGYTMPTGSLFIAKPANPNAPWLKGDEDMNSFAR